MANEVLYKLSDTENNNTNKYKASIFDGVVINDVNVSRGKARLILELVTFNCPIRRKCCLEHRL